jgi:hypothetical protein
VDVQPLGLGVKYAARHEPRRQQAQRHPKQLRVRQPPHRQLQSRPSAPTAPSVQPCSRPSTAPKPAVDRRSARLPHPMAGRDGGMASDQTKGCSSGQLNHWLRPYPHRIARSPKTGKSLRPGGGDTVASRLARKPQHVAHRVESRLPAGRP